MSGVLPAARDALADRFERRRSVLGAAAVFVATFAAYATGAFAVDGGVVFLPVDATNVGVVLAAGAGYRRGSLLDAWLAPFAAYLGFHAEWAFLGLSSHGLAGKLAFLLDPASLGVFAVAAVVLGTAAYGVGSLVGVGVERVRAERDALD